MRQTLYCSSGEGWVGLEDTTCFARLVHVVREDDVVWVTHGYECAFVYAVMCQKKTRPPNFGSSMSTVTLSTYLYV